MSELNKQLLEAIFRCYNEIYERDGNLKSEFQPAANECERICLQAMIDLVEKLEESYGKMYYTKSGIQEQLKQLNK